MRRKLIVGNWKMNGGLAANEALLKGILDGDAGRECDMAVCAPAPYLAQCRAILDGTGIHWGAQDVSPHTAGAYTGEIAVSMLADFACRYAIVGHSERRDYHAESDEAVARKAVAALDGGIVPIACVGETLAEREAGRTGEVVGRQIDAILEAVGGSRSAGVVFAYEPVWAIGTGRTATPEMAQEVHAALRQRIARLSPDAARAARILYGGSMKPENARSLLAMPDIDGGLIGGAALKAADFLAIAKAAGGASSA